MKRNLAVFVAAVAALVVLGAANPAGAADEATRYGCTVLPHTPYITVINGVRYAEANVYVRCDTGYTVIVNGKIMEADPGSDDQVVFKTASATVPGDRLARKVLTMRGRCSNFDPTGAEELFTTAMINVGGVNSAWAQTYEISTTC